jgi:hypothetical protein
MAKHAAESPGDVKEQPPSAKAIVVRLEKQQHKGKQIEGVGAFTRKLDTALPGKHTRLLYNSFKWNEAAILAQLRTGMSRLNAYLYRINAAETDLCACGQAKETIEHFLFRCSRWDQLRQTMLRQADLQPGCLSYFLGGKAASQSSSWKPNLAVVRATVRYAIATGRLAFDTT